MKSNKERSGNHEEMIENCNKMIETATALRDYFVSTADAVPKNPVEESPRPTEPETTATIPTKTDVRAVLAARAAAGYKAEVQALLQKYGATQLAAVDPQDYANIIAEAEVIGDV